MKTDRSPVKVGLTGGIGAGKSVIAKVFKVLGIPVYDADSRAKYLLAHDPALKQSVVDSFGTDAYLETGEPNRPYLAEKVFADEEKLAVLNGLVHPLVGEDFETWYGQQQGPYVIKEAALLFESESYKTLDKIITVTATEKERINRTVLRDIHRTEQQVRDIISRQMPAGEKEQMANYVIKNDKGDTIIPQVLSLHDRLNRLYNK
ncbi:MAG: dephospho-CoA kinase [Cyclobacteriaceae bacterium]